MFYKANPDIEIKIASSLQPKWKIAEAIGIADTTFSKWLRHTLSPDKRERVLAAIERLSKEAVGDVG